MDRWRILIVEDDAPIRRLIASALSADYTLFTAETADMALKQAAAVLPDTILLDLGLPDGDGLEVIRQIRSWSDVPIIVLSARDEERDKVEALDAGADDYLTKPFSVAELHARLRSTRRRLAHQAAGNRDAVFRNGMLTIDYTAGRASLNGEELKLTPMEYRLLCLLARNAGRVLTHKQINRHLWGPGLEDNLASLRVVMASLRKKLEGDNCIQTHIGIGYRMVKRD